MKITLLLVSCLTIMSIVTISPSLPEMSKAFGGIDNAEFLVKMVLTLPALFIAISAPLAGILIDRYGRLPMLWGALILYALAGSAGYFLDNLYIILGSRAILGIAVGISMTIVTTLVADYFEGLERQKFVGTQVAFMSIGGILFIGFGGILADISWRLPFLIYLLSLPILPLSIIYLREPDRVRKNNVAGDQIKSPSFIWVLFFNVMIMWILFFIIPVQIPFHLKAIGVEKNALIGAAIAMSTAFSAISSFSFSRLKNRFSHFTIFSIGYVLMAMAFGVLALIPSYTAVVVAMMLGGFGMGMMIPNTNMWVMQIAPQEIRGREIGRLTTFWFMGQFLSPIILWPFVMTVGQSGTFFMVAGLLLTLSLVSLKLQVCAAKTTSLSHKH